ncbi:MAG: amidase family protein [Rhizomicrobium sp.]
MCPSSASCRPPKANCTVQHTIPGIPAHSTGGSSGGSAAAVAAGIVPIAHATRWRRPPSAFPASACGLVGLKATRGRVTQGPEAGDATSGLSIDGVVTKSVRDTAAALDALCGIDYGDPYFALPPEGSYLEGIRRKVKRLKIAVSTRMLNGKLHDPEVTAAVKKTAKLCESLGHIVEETDPPLNAGELVGRFLHDLVRQRGLWLKALERLTGIAAVAHRRRRAHLRPVRMGLKVSAVELTEARQAMVRAGRAVANGTRLKTYG